MRRWPGLVVGLAAVGAALLAAGSSPVAADEQRRVEVLRHLGGARLGVAVDDVRADDLSRLKLTEERGALVRRVEKDSAAEKAGVREGDVVVRYQGQGVESAAALRRMVRETPSGRKVGVEVSRQGTLHKLTATLEGEEGPIFPGLDLDLEGSGLSYLPRRLAIPDVEVERRDDEGDRVFMRRFHLGGPRRLGIEFQDLEGQLAAYFEAPSGGVLVTSVDEGSVAEKAGLKAGDVIVKWNGEAVDDGRGLRRRVSRSAAGAKVALSVLRAGKALELEVTFGSETPKKPGATT